MEPIRQVRHNRRCRLIVVASGYQTAYCSPQCRYAAQKRAQRAKLREQTIKAGNAASKKGQKKARRSWTS
jgi:hypothetical protein